MSRDARRRMIALVAAGLIAGCSGGQRQSSNNSNASDTPEGAPASGGGDEGGSVEADASDQPGDGAVETSSASGPPACQAYQNSAEADPLRRWIDAFPIRMGGAVLIFSGAQAEQMEVETMLEMQGVSGYEDHTCGTHVVVWVPGFVCEGEEQTLARQIEGGTNMNIEDTTCFRIDETRLRIREECRRGTLPADLCQ